LQGGGAKLISIGDYTCIQSHSILGCWERYNAFDGQQIFTPSITIGKNCSIGEYTQITSCNKITIGDGLLTGRYVYIGDNSHGGLTWEEADIPPIRRRLKTKGEIVIGNNVWIGDKVTILSGVIIGDNVIIGANSVVTHDVPSNTVAIGMPAKILKSL
jgi:acetyltransferase-like isoleucine patch superfamily enzyme